MNKYYFILLLDYTSKLNGKFQMPNILFYLMIMNNFEKPIEDILIFLFSKIMQLLQYMEIYRIRFIIRR